MEYCLVKVSRYIFSSHDVQTVQTTDYKYKVRFSMEMGMSIDGRTGFSINLIGI